ncbi:MAG: hypothetical protein COB41_00540 [Proteobacteria bacterium]|nr:MAG: hypothetical protein COB41_00540 [Pseudomonadota bacterium]
MKKYEITIIADTNDADYVTSINEICESDLLKIRPLIEQVSNFKTYKSNECGYEMEHNHNWSIGDSYRGDLGEKSPRELYKATEEVFQILEELIPCGEYGIHTLESIEISPLQKKEQLL